MSTGNVSEVQSVCSSAATFWIYKPDPKKLRRCVKHAMQWLASPFWPMLKWIQYKDQYKLRILPHELGNTWEKLVDKHSLTQLIKMQIKTISRQILTTSRTSHFKLLLEIADVASSRPNYVFHSVPTLLEFGMYFLVVLWTVLCPTSTNTHVHLF